MTAWLTPEDGASRSLPAGLSTEDIARIDTALEAHHAPSTLYSYGSAWRGFERWCHERGFTPLPAAPEVVCAYITSQAERGLTMGMVTGSLAAISHRHASAGLSNPTDGELVRRVRRGLRRILGVAPRSRARPLLIDDIRHILAAVDRTTAAGKRDAALILLGFASALRRSELAGLDVADLAAKPVFTRVHANGTVSSHSITAASVARIVKTRAHTVGFSADRITAHSLRAGHATSAAMAGVSLDRIAAQTHHRDLGTLVNNYIRPIETMTTTSSRHLGL
jgi:site-specific recombinase XerD